MTLQNLRWDLGDAARCIWRDRTFTGAVVVTFALTIGMTTAVFSVVNGVVLKPLAYRQADQLVVVREIVPPLAHLYPSLPANPRHFDLWRRHAQTFAALAELQAISLPLIGIGNPMEVSAVRTTAGLFETLDVQPAFGRAFEERDETVGGPDVVILTDAFWHRQFGGDPGVVGRTLILEGRPHTAIGVLPEGFRFPDRLGPLTTPLKRVDVLVPLRLTLTDFSQLGEFNYAVVGRLKPGVRTETANDELNRLEASIELPAKVALLAQVQPLMEVVVGQSRQALWLLLAAIAGVLLIACANLANLSLTRTISHLRDAAIRTALGATRTRLIQAVVFEQLLLALVGGAAGVLVAAAALAAFVRTAPIDLPRLAEVTLDRRVLLFAAAISIVAGLLVALFPAWRLAGAPAQTALRADVRTASGDRAGVTTRGLLLSAQVALSVTLLVVTTLLTISFVRLTRVDPAFVPAGLLTMRVALPPNRYGDQPARVRFYDRIMEALATVPGVEQAAWTSKLPLQGEDWVDAVAPVGQVRSMTDTPIANFRFVSPGFFRALRMPIARGRAFTERDRDAPAVAAVVSEATAAKVWPGQPALGQRFHRAGSEAPFEVVGVVPDGRATRLDAPPPLMVYVPYWYRTRLMAALVIRTHADPASAIDPIRQAIWAADRDAVIADVRPMTDVAVETLGARRYNMLLFVAFGVVALFIAIVGIYAVTAYGIARRRREMNIRLALGARDAQVRWLILRQGAGPIAFGLAAGLLGAAGLGNIVASFLVDVRGRDPQVLVGVTAAVGAVALLSALAAIGRGLRLDPAAALRDE